MIGSIARILGYHDLVAGHLLIPVEYTMVVTMRALSAPRSIKAHLYPDLSSFFYTTSVLNTI